MSSDDWKALAPYLVGIVGLFVVRVISTDAYFTALAYLRPFGALCVIVGCIGTRYDRRRRYRERQ